MALAGEPVMNKLIKQVDSRAVSVEVTEVEDIPIQKMFTMHPTGVLRPTRAEMRWEDGELVKLIVSGRRIKNSGEPGLADSSTIFISYGRLIQDKATWPKWLWDLVFEYQPNVGTFE